MKPLFTMWNGYSQDHRLRASRLRWGGLIVVSKGSVGLVGAVLQPRPMAIDYKSPVRAET